MSAVTPAGSTADAPVRHYTAEEKRHRIFAIVGASSGNLVEWFDFYIYAFCALYFAPAFFPKSDSTAQLLNTAGVFAAGFLMRPIGGWLFGRIADRKGRKTSMVISVTMMCAGSLVIACLPTYASIGAWAPALLLMARLFQGLSVGGEYGTTATYMSEVALRGQRGFFSSFQYVTLIGGQLMAVLVIVILEQLLSEAELKAWGWRIPFVIGALTAVVAMQLRRSCTRLRAARAAGNREAGTLAGLFRHHKAAFFTVLGFTAGGSLIFYTFTTYMQKYLVNTVGLPIKTTSYVLTCALFVYMCMQPVFGALSDRIGRRNNMLLFGALGALADGADPHRACGNVTQPGARLRADLVALAIVELLHLDQRHREGRDVPARSARPRRGPGLRGRQRDLRRLGRIRGAGLKSLGHESSFFWYVTAMMVIAFFVSWRLPRQASLPAPRSLIAARAH